ncbi:MAG: hypothetical protein J6I52_11745 [Prevotella sp.]|nr:hypothetical protein [Prevotella sp.]
MGKMNINSLNAARKGWKSSTELGCDVKTILSSDDRMKTGKDYLGVLRRDSDGVVDEFLCRDPHYTFTEMLPTATAKRNPRLFDGQYITITRRENGSLHPNFKHIDIGKGFSVDGFAIAVMGELRQGLKGLVEE